MGYSKNTRPQGARQNEKKKTGQKREALLQKAYALHQQGHIQQAIQAYEYFISRFPSHTEALGNYGLLLHSQGQQAQAVDLYQQAVRLSAGMDHLYYFLGNGLRELGRPKEAIAAYTKALATKHQQENTINSLIYTTYNTTRDLMGEVYKYLYN